MFKDNPIYTKQGEFDGISVYTCLKETDYHTTRYIEALNWQTFASCGVTKEKLKGLTDKIIELCNEDKPAKTFRTDIASITNLIQLMLKFM